MWSLALFPASFVFSMTYPSAIFLAASVWAFVLVEEHHDLAAGLVAVGAALVRPNGVVLAVALVVAVWWSWRRAVLVAGPSVVAVVAWCVYCADRTGDPFVFLTTKSRWQEITFVGLFEGHVKWSVLPHVVLALAALVVLVVQRKPPPTLVAGVRGALPRAVVRSWAWSGWAATPTSASRRSSAPGRSSSAGRRRTQYAVLAASTVGLVLFAFVAARYELVP